MTTDETMKAASEELTELGASYEYPGFIAITKGEVDYAFGDINGDYGYNRGDCEPMECGVPDLSRTATVAELVEWVRRVMATV